eukprot:jgi/Pico_ML_1/53891/g4359.t1
MGSNPIARSPAHLVESVDTVDSNSAPSGSRFESETPPRPRGGPAAPNSYRARVEARRTLKALYGALPTGPLQRALRRSGGDPLALLRRLECRLDVLLYRSNWALTLREARHTVVRGGVQVNGSTQSLPGQALRPGDLFQIDPRWAPRVAERLRTNLRDRRFLQHRPPHLEVRDATLQAFLLFPPQEMRQPLPLPLHALKVR